MEPTRGNVEPDRGTFPPLHMHVSLNETFGPQKWSTQVTFHCRFPSCGDMVAPDGTCVLFIFGLEVRGLHSQGEAKQGAD